MAVITDEELLDERSLNEEPADDIRPSLRSFSVLRRLRTLLQRFAVPDPAFAGVAGEFEVLGEFEGVDGTSVFAEAAEHAAAQVVGEVGEFLAAGVLVARAGDHDQVLRAGEGAK